MIGFHFELMVVGNGVIGVPLVGGPFICAMFNLLVLAKFVGVLMWGMEIMSLVNCGVLHYFVYFVLILYALY